MQQDYHSPLPSSKLNIQLTLLQKIKLENNAKELGMNNSQYISYLLENYEGDNINIIKRFRYNLIRRVKKGINIMYINELKKLNTYLNILLERL